MKYKISNEKVVITIYYSYLCSLSKMPLETIYSFVRRERKSNKKQKDQEKYVAVVAYIAHKKREAEYL